MIKDQMEEIYSNIPPEKIPWNIETPPNILIDLVESKTILPCKVIDLGCGAGNYTCYFASKGFESSGVDISSTAINLAKKTAKTKELNCNLIHADFLSELEKVDGPYDFAYDWEVLHHIFPVDRHRYANNVFELLRPTGKYLSVCFSEESTQFGGTGKYRKTPLETILYFSSESEIRELFDNLFDIQELKTIEIEGKFGIHKAIYAFMKKKDNYGINSDRKTSAV